MKRIDLVLIELPQDTVLKALQNLMTDYQEGVIFDYLRRLIHACEENCQKRHDLFVRSMDFYRLMLMGLERPGENHPSDQEIGEIFNFLPEIMAEILRSKHSMAERFALEIFSVAPITNKAILGRIVAGLPATALSTEDIAVHAPTFTLPSA